MDKAKNRGNKQKKISLKFVVDCSKPVEDKVFSTNAFAEFLKARIKVNGKTGHLGESVNVASDPKNVTVSSSIALSKRYLKYLTKKYLKKHSLRQFLYVVATNKTSYQIRYFNIQQENGDEQ